MKEFNPNITHHFAIAHRAYNAAIAFGLGLLSSIRSELQDAGIKITERQAYEIIQELDNKKHIEVKS